MSPKKIKKSPKETKAKAEPKKPKEKYYKLPKEISWEVPEYIFHEKGGIWYILLAIIIIGFIVTFALVEQYLAMIAIFLAGIIFYSWADRKPQKIQVKISEKGITIRGQLTAYNELRKFYIIDSPLIKRVYFQPIKLWRTPITVLLGNQDSTQLRLFLLQYLPEYFQKRADFLDVLNHWLKF